MKIGGMLHGSTYPSGKASTPAQKFLFWLDGGPARSHALIVTGLILDFPNFDQTRSTMQIANVIHMIAGVARRSRWRACTSTSARSAWRAPTAAMRDGYVDESWAEHHHLRWYQRVAAGQGA